MHDVSEHNQNSSQFVCVCLPQPRLPVKDTENLKRKHGVTESLEVWRESTFSQRLVTSFPEGEHFLFWGGKVAKLGLNIIDREKDSTVCSPYCRKPVSVVRKGDPPNPPPSRSDEKRKRRLHLLNKKYGMEGVRITGDSLYDVESLCEKRSQGGPKYPSLQGGRENPLFPYHFQAQSAKREKRKNSDEKI